MIIGKIFANFFIKKNPKNYFVIFRFSSERIKEEIELKKKILQTSLLYVNKTGYYSI